jgi:hypothetical protein
MRHRMRGTTIFQGLAVWVFVASLSFFHGCSGGGSSSSGPSGTPGIAGPASVTVNIGGGDVAPSVSDIPANLLSPADAGAPVPALKPVRGSYLHVYAYVTGVAFLPKVAIPSSDLGPPTVDGEEMADRETDFDSRFVVSHLPEPLVVDLLNPPSSRQLARFLNKVEIPAGVYGKIRVYYSKIVVVYPDGTEKLAHPTANYHFDVHFKSGDLGERDDVHLEYDALFDTHYLVIPVAPNPADGVRLWSVAIRITGLKIHETGKGKVILRPQVFAELAKPVKYSVTGRAENVDHVIRSFDIRTPANRFEAFYQPTTLWAFDDNVFDPLARKVGMDNVFAIAAFRNGAYVEAIGDFHLTASHDLLLHAQKVSLTFPDERRGVVDNGWRAGDTFVLRSPSDNVVFPKPDRFTAYYDNAVAPFAPLTDAAIDNNVRVKARGYNAFDPSGNPIGIDAFWISVGP